MEMYQKIPLQQLSSLQWQRYFEFHQYLQQELQTPFEHPNDFDTFMKMKKYILKQEDTREYTYLEGDKIVAWLQYKIYGYQRVNAYSEIYFDTSYRQIPKDLLQLLQQTILQCQTFYEQDRTYAFEAHNPRFGQLIQFCEAEVIGTNAYFELEKENTNNTLIKQLLEGDLLEENQLKFAFYDSLPERHYADYARLFNEGFSNIPRFSPVPIELMTLESTTQMVQNFTQSGNQLFTAWLLDENNQAIAYTLIYLQGQNDKRIGTQWLTVVTKQYQGKKLAQYLKAAMLQSIFDAISELEVIQTNCTAMNYPMIAINEKLGFHRVGEKHEYAL